MQTDIPHVMIDLETMGTSCIAAPMSIGAVVFTMQGDIKGTYHTGIELKSCVDIGMEVDPGTIEWWMKQSKENQDRVLSLKRKPIGLALQGMIDVFNSIGLNRYMTCMWSHGSIFDMVIVENAFRLLGKTEMWWKFTNVRDTRTLFDVANYEYKAKGGHDALEDAMSQAEAVVAAYQQLVRGGKNGSN